MVDEGPSLRTLFASARDKYQQLEQGTLEPKLAEKTFPSAIDELATCTQLVIKGGIFSSNEEIEDVSTPDIPYFTIDYILADFMLRSYGSDRKETLQRVVALLESFLARLELYGILSTSNRKLLERFREENNSFSIASRANAEDRRRIKVARFQDEKAMKQKLEYLRSQTGMTGADDEILRSLYLTEIESYANKTFESIDLANQEMAILSQAQREPENRPPQADGRQQIPGINNGYSERLDGPRTQARQGGPLLSSSGKPLQPFTLTDKRTQIREGVFRPGHNLPTMSIDEYLEEERRRGGIIDGGGNSQQAPVEVDEDNMALIDAETMKAREWDEFVEANQKGAGNTLNRG